MSLQGLSYSARKSLGIHIGESAANEIADVIQRLVLRVADLERNKVSVTHIAPPEAENLIDTAILVRRAA